MLASALLLESNKLWLFGEAEDEEEEDDEDEDEEVAAAMRPLGW